MKDDQKPKPSSSSESELNSLLEALPETEGVIPRTRQLSLMAQDTLMTRRAGLKNQEMVHISQIMQNPQRDSDSLELTSKQSLLVSVLARKLDEVGQVYRVEILPAQARVWQEVFWNEKPEAIVWAFHRHFQNGRYPPRPADIAQLIRAHRESLYFDGWAV